jgi:hypothetical protein
VSIIPDLSGSVYTGESILNGAIMQRDLTVEQIITPAIKTHNNCLDFQVRIR